MGIPHMKDLVEGFENTDKLMAEQLPYVVSMQFIKLLGHTILQENVSMDYKTWKSHLSGNN